jgi:hypothetical protein
MNDIPRTDPQVLKERAREARELVENRAFLEAVATLRKQWFGELILAQDDRKTLETAAKLRALDAIPQRLASAAQDAEFAKRGS